MSEILCDTTSTTDDHMSSNETALRRRNPWNSLVADGIDLLADVDELDDEEEEDGAGCPLPSTPEDNQLLEAEVKHINKVQLFFLLLCIVVWQFHIIFVAVVDVSVFFVHVNVVIRLSCDSVTLVESLL